MIRELSHWCSATGLAFSMHTHLIATLAWIWRSGNKAPEGMLRRVAAEKLVLVSTGGVGWRSRSPEPQKRGGGGRPPRGPLFWRGGPRGGGATRTRRST